MKTHIFLFITIAVLCLLPVESGAKEYYLEPGYASNYTKSDFVPLDPYYGNLSDLYFWGGDGDIYWYYAYRIRPKADRVLYLTQRYDDVDPWMNAEDYWSHDDYEWVEFVWLDTWHVEEWNRDAVNNELRTQVRCNYTIRNIGSCAFANSNVLEFYYFIVTNTLSRDDRYHHWGENAALTSHMQRIDRYAFSNSKIRYMEIGPKVTSIGEFAFYKCSDLQTFTSFASEPPPAPHSFYESNAPNATLVVPVNCVSKYRTSGYWYHFGTIQDMNGRPYDDATSILLNHPDTIRLTNLYDTCRLTCSLTPAVTGALTWSSSDTKIVAVSNTGKLTVTGNGMVVVTARTTNGLTASLVVNTLGEDASLRALQAGAFALSPAFNANTLNYTVTVPYATNNITLVAVRNHLFATFTGDGTKQLSVGNNTFPIVVTAQSGNQKTYTVTVHRKSNDATLQSLQVNTGTLSPAFNANTLNYTVTVPCATENITLTAAKNHASADFSGAGAKQLAVGDNPFPIPVTAEDNLYKKTYTVTVHRTSNDATLASLQVNTGTLSPAFNANTLHYIVTVPCETEYITLTATKNDNFATLTGTGNGTKALNVGDNPFHVTVASEDGAQLTYTLIVHRLSNDATLRQLDVITDWSQYPLTPPFDPAILEYELRVPNAVTALRVDAQPKYDLATVAVVGGNTLNVGNNTVTVTVTPEDGTTPLTYTLTVYRQSDAHLQSLSYTYDTKTITHEFDADSDKDSISVPHSVSGIILQGFANRADAEVTGDGEKELAFGDNVFEVTVLPEDVTIPVTYSITVHRESNDAALASLHVPSGNFSPAFSPATLRYTVTVPEAVTGIDIEATVNYPLASVSGGGPKQLGLRDSTFQVTVVAENGESNIYMLTVHRVSNDATLAALEVSGHTLSPEFRYYRYEYTVVVPGSTSAVTVIAPTTSETARVSGDGINPVNVGDNSLPVTVTAENGDSLIYTVNVHRASNNAVLRLLTLDRGYLSPAFHPEILHYTAVVSNLSDEVTITAEKLDPNAEITGHTGNQPLVPGKNTFQVAVTSEDGSVVRTYTLDVYQKSGDATLRSLKVDIGALSPSFDANTFNYELTVPSSLSGFVITAEANHSLATVSGDDRRDLSGGDSRFDIGVIAEDGMTQQIYTINILRISDDATLKSLTVGIGAFPLPIEPLFDPNVYDYEVPVSHNYTTVVSVSAAATRPPATVNIPAPVLFTQNYTVLQVTVTAEYGNRSVYSLHLTRASSTGIRESGAAVRVYADGGLLHIHTPAAERIEIHSVSGVRLYASDKPAGETAIALPPAAGVWIIRGSSGWVRKVILQ